MPRRRPYDEVKYIIAAALGIPLLAGLVFTLLVIVNTVWQATNAIGGILALVVGVAVLIVATYKAVELLRNSGGGGSRQRL